MSACDCQRSCTWSAEQKKIEANPVPWSVSLARGTSTCHLQRQTYQWAFCIAVALTHYSLYTADVVWHCYQHRRITEREAIGERLINRKDTRSQVYAVAIGDMCGQRCTRFSDKAAYRQMHRYRYHKGEIAQMLQGPMPPVVYLGMRAAVMALGESAENRFLVSNLSSVRVIRC